MADVRLTATNPEDSSVVPVACDAGGRLLLQELPAFDGTVDGDLTVSGKGSFAGGKSIIGNDGSAQFAQGAVDIYANGTVEFAQDVNFDGSATFAGDVIVGPTNGGSGTNASGVYSGKEGYISLFKSDTETSDFFNCRKFGVADPLAIIKNDGSAVFAGDEFRISNGGELEMGPWATGQSCKLVPGAISVRSDDTAAGAYVWRCFKGGAANTNITSLIAPSGSATFAGNKAGFTKEGYLWCTTRRGDTVILDATSNGLASWVEYTPTSRIDDLRDKLDAKRPDTGEMPADTP